MATPQELLSASSCFRCLTDGQLDVVAVSLLSEISLNGGGGGGGLVSLTTGVTGILPVANGGTGTSTGFTQGSVVFAGPAGVYAQDNANFFWDDTNNRLGIGTATPSTTLEVLGQSTFRYGFATGALKIGADLNATTISVNVRKLGRITMPSYDGGATNTYLFGGDLQTGVNDLYFGGVTAGSQYAATGLHFFTGATQTTTGGTERLTIYNDGNVGIGIAIPLASLHIVPLTAPALLISPFGAAAGNTGEFRLRELTANGTSHTGFKAPDSMAASEIYVLPNAAPSANRFLQAAAVAGGVSALSWAQVSLTADVTGILPVANGGSGTSTAFTAGSVIFAGAAGVFSQDNANFFWDDTNNWLGLGIAVPLARLHVVSSAAATVVEIVKAAAAQSANLMEWQSSAGVVNTAINAAGNISIPTTTATVGIVFQNALRFIHTFGTTNLFIGRQAGNLITSGTGINIGIGDSALLANTTGAQNIGIGLQALGSNTEGSNNTALGSQALVFTTTGVSNSAFGFNALFTNVTGSRNMGFGYSALFLNTGSNNIGIGYSAGNNLTTGSNNIIIGYDIDSPTATNSNTLTIGNLIFGTGIDGGGTATSSGGIGIGVITPTAKLHLAAGTTAASTAPLKFNTGTSMTAAEAGAVEFTTDDLFFTITTGAARKRLLMADATAGLTSGKMPIATTNGRLIDLTASAAYTPTNVTTDRSFDANATSTDELADLIGTIIADLQTKGILG